MNEEGIVSDVKDGKLIVSIKRHAACGSCKACSAHDDKIMRIEFENTISARKGDKVNVELDDFTILKGACLFYIVPLSGLFLGIFAGMALAENMNLAMPKELVSALCGVVTMLVTFVGIRRYNLVKNKGKYNPKISKV